MSVKLLTEHSLEFLSLKEGCTGSSESTLAKMPHCWKSHVAAHMSPGAMTSKVIPAQLQDGIFLMFICECLDDFDHFRLRLIFKMRRGRSLYHTG